MSKYDATDGQGKRENKNETKNKKFNTFMTKRVLCPLPVTSNPQVRMMCDTVKCK